MSIFDKLFNKENKNICKDKKSPYYNYPNDLKDYCEYEDKYQYVWNLIGEYTQKINTYYSDYINTNNKEAFNNLFIYCNKYFDLIPKFEEARKEDTKINGTIYKSPYYCVAYHKLAMDYEKAQCYNSAINLCKEAIAKGYTDGTKGGFEARLKRLQKEQDETKNN